MLAGAHNYVKIAGRPAMRSGVAFAGQANALPIARARLDAHRERISTIDHAFAAADIADGARMSGAAAARAGNIELHASGGLGHLAGALALGTDAWGFEVSRAVAVGANILPRDVQAQLGAANGLPETDVDLVFEVAALLWPFIGNARAAASAKNSGEDIAETATSRSAARLACAAEVGKIEAAEVEGNALSTRTFTKTPAGRVAARTTAAGGIGRGGCGINVVGVEADLVVNFSLLRVAEDIIGLGNFFELFFRLLVARIDVRMVFARQLTEGLANLFARRSFFYSQYPVVILSGWHELLRLVALLLAQDFACGLGRPQNGSTCEFL